MEARTRLREASRLAPDDARRHAIDKIVLPVVKESEWSDSLVDASMYPTVQSPEWVTFIGAPDTGFGLTLPDDDSPTEKLSFFTEAEGYRTVDIALTGPNNVITNTSEDHHCPLPERSYCSSPGSCGATCQRHEVVQSRGRGLICLCAHRS